MKDGFCLHSFQLVFRFVCFTSDEETSCAKVLSQGLEDHCHPARYYVQCVDGLSTRMHTDLSVTGKSGEPWHHAWWTPDWCLRETKGNK